MSLRYLFPCPKCAHTIELATKQAGQRLVCPECQSEWEAPKLGLLRQLEVAADSKSVSQRTTAGGLKSWLFVAGLAIAVLGGAAGGALYQYSTKLISRVDIEGSSDLFDSQTDQLTESGVVEAFEELPISDGLGEWYEQVAVRYSNQGKILVTTSYCIFGLSGIGLLMLIGSFFIRK